MRCLAIAILVVGCAGEGRSPGEPNEPDEPIETARFLPLLCTSGTPGTPNCPMNDVALDTLGVSGSLRFVAHALAGGPVLSSVVFHAGADGLYLEHPTFVVYRTGDPTGTVTTAFSDAVLNIPPDTSQEPPNGGSAALVVNGTFELALRFDAIGPYRP